MPWLTVMGNIAFAVTSRWPGWDKARVRGALPEVHRSRQPDGSRKSARRSFPAA